KGGGFCIGAPKKHAAKRETVCAPDQILRLPPPSRPPNKVPRFDTIELSSTMASADVRVRNQVLRAEGEE
ncbi:hypothetical protein, partial [Burkholderia cenocepacia]|uniref:hypothetical protein n=4 Tax=Burkholderia cenocepacia TaxID=95486 RepID=UPI001F4BBAAA